MRKLYESRHTKDLDNAKQQVEMMYGDKTIAKILKGIL
jgi:hypothetical protein